MKLKSLISTLKSNFSTTDKWTKSWEENQDYMGFMQESYDDTDPNRLALGLIKPKTQILSAGCGPGREVKFLVNLECDVLGIDHSEKMIELSQKNEPKAKYIVGSIVNFKSNDKFDYILCLYNTMNYLHNFKARRKFIENSYNNLKQGGKLIIITKHKFSHLGAFLRSIISNKNFCYSPKQIDRWFKDLGFKVKKTKIGDEILIIAEK
tara:strand:- start:1129 stop:1752 length:624 start_codon:yes stop_codon:yes gene_type:complete